MSPKTVLISMLGWLLVASSPALADGGSPEQARQAAVAKLIETIGLRESSQASRDFPGWQRPRKVLVARMEEAQLQALQAVVPGVNIVAVNSVADAVRQAGDAQVMIGYCSQDVFDAGPEIRWVQVYSSGVDRCVPLPGMASGERMLSNGQGMSSPALAEHAIALMMGVARGLDIYHGNQMKQDWQRNVGLEGMAFAELDGRTALIVGLGGIGRQTARRAHGLGMRVLATRGSRREGPDYVEYVGLADEALELARQADVVINTAPLTDATRGMFDAEFFAAMKPTAYFVSVGRGASTNTDDLVAALRNGDIAGAGLDVTDPEPLPSNHPLWKMPRVIITPHVGGRSDRGYDRLLLLVQENLRRYVNGEPLLSQVDIERGY